VTKIYFIAQGKNRPPGIHKKKVAAGQFPQ